MSPPPNRTITLTQDITCTDIGDYNDIHDYAENHPDMTILAEDANAMTLCVRIIYEVD